jgi:predicted AAA+ superfamily ATPase
MLPRDSHIQRVEALLKGYPIVAILGARQVGKTTLARLLGSQRQGPVTYFDLEDPRVAARLEDPMLALEPLRGLIVLDEIHRSPGIFRALRVLADRPRRPAAFLVLGSASMQLLEQASESLAGRIAYYDLDGLSLEEVGPAQLDKLWLRGGFPRSYTLRTLAESRSWRQDFIRNFLGRDLPAFGVRTSAESLRRFWTMLAHWHGQIWNASEFARSFGVADTTMRNYLELLASTFVVRILRPWHENLSKRQVKSPKVYIADSGILHSLLDVESKSALENSPKLGASWEGFALAQVIAWLRPHPHQCYFWRTHTGAELDLMVIQGAKRLGFEFKYTDTPSVTPSIRSALADLHLQELVVVHAGAQSFPMAKKVRAVALARLLTDVRAGRR